MSDRVQGLPLALPFLTAPAARGGAQPPTVTRSGPSRRPRLPMARSLAVFVAAAWRRHSSRVRLAQLDAHLLRDIGITYAEAEQEANKPFWRA